MTALRAEPSFGREEERAERAGGSPADPPRFRTERGKKMEERPARQLPNLLFGRRLLLLDQLDAEFPAALDEENALRRGVARRRVSAVCRLEQVRAGSQPRLGLPFLPVDPSARDDHDLVIGRMRVERRGETGRELLDGAVGALGRIAPELGECRSGWRTGQRLELEISRRPRDKSLCARLLGRLGLAGLGGLRQQSGGDQEKNRESQGLLPCSRHDGPPSPLILLIVRSWEGEGEGPISRDLPGAGLRFLFLPVCRRRSIARLRAARAPLRPL